MDLLPDKKGTFSTDALCIAAVAGDVKLLEEQIQNVASVSERHAATGLYPLHFAAKGGNLQCVELLLSRETIDVNCVARNGETPLHFAVNSASKLSASFLEGDGRECILICEQLVSHGADIMTLSTNEKSPLLYALSGVNSTSVRLLKVLLKNDAELGSDSEIGTMDIAYGKATSALLSAIKFVNSSLELNVDKRLNFIKVASRLEALKTLIHAHGTELMRNGHGGKLKSVLSRSLQSKLFTSVLQDFKTFDERTVASYVGPMMCEAVRFNGDVDYETFVTLLTRPIVQMFNQFSIPFHDQPLIKCLGNLDKVAEHQCDFTGYEKLKQLLELGFDPRVPLVVKNFHDCEFGSTFALLQDNIIPKGDFPSLNIISHILYTIGDCFENEVAPEYRLVRLLVQHGAHTTAQCENEFSPMMFLCRIDERCVAQIYELFMSNGVDLNRRSAGNTFRCSDFVLAAAVTGKFFSGARAGSLAKDMGLNPIDVLADLCEFRFSPMNDGEKQLFSRAIAMFLGPTLKYTVVWDSAFTMFDTLDEKLCDGESFLRGTARNSYGPIGVVPRLGSVCRATIRDTVANRKLCDMKAKIELLPLPCHVKKYLMFDDE